MSAKRLIPGALLASSAFGGGSRDNLDDCMGTLCVKNTFIDVPQPPMAPLFRRSETVPMGFGSRKKKVWEASTCGDLSEIEECSDVDSSDMEIGVKNTFVHVQPRENSDSDGQRPRRHSEPVPQPAFVKKEDVDENSFVSTPLSQPDDTARQFFDNVLNINSHLDLPPPPSHAPILPWNVFFPTFPTTSSAPQLLPQQPMVGFLQPTQSAPEVLAHEHASETTQASEECVRPSANQDLARLHREKLSVWRQHLQKEVAQKWGEQLPSVTEGEDGVSILAPEKQLLLHIEPKFPRRGERETLSLVSRSGAVWGTLDMKASAKVDQWQSRFDRKVNFQFLEVPEHENQATSLAKIGVKPVQQMTRNQDAQGRWHSQHVYMVPTKVLEGEADLEDYRVRAVFKTKEGARRLENETKKEKRDQLRKRDLVQQEYTWPVPHPGRWAQ